jgi:hypothetical protein
VRGALRRWHVVADGLHLARLGQDPVDDRLRAGVVHVVRTPTTTPGGSFARLGAVLGEQLGDGAL